MTKFTLYNNLPEQIEYITKNTPSELVEVELRVGVQARIQEFTLVGAPWIGEGSGDRQGPQRVQGAQWGALGGEAPRKLMRIRNLRR